MKKFLRDVLVLRSKITTPFLKMCSLHTDVVKKIAYRFFRVRYH